MYEYEELAVALDDLQDARQVVEACFNYFTAEDVLRAQRQFSRVRRSPLTAELERVKTRLEGVLGDYFLRKHDAEAEEPDPEVTEEEAGEALSVNPLGSRLPKGQRGQRLVPKYLQDGDESNEDAELYDEPLDE